MPRPKNPPSPPPLHAGLHPDCTSASPSVRRQLARPHTPNSRPSPAPSSSRGAPALSLQPAFSATLRVAPLPTTLSPGLHSLLASFAAGDFVVLPPTFSANPGPPQLQHPPSRSPALEATYLRSTVGRSTPHFSTSANRPYTPPPVGDRSPPITVHNRPPFDRLPLHRRARKLPLHPNATPKSPGPAAHHHTLPPPPPVTAHLQSTHTAAPLRSKVDNIARSPATITSPLIALRRSRPSVTNTPTRDFRALADHPSTPQPPLPPFPSLLFILSSGPPPSRAASSHPAVHSPISQLFRPTA